MAGKTTRVPVKRKLAGEAMRFFGAKCRSETARNAVKEFLDRSAEIERHLRKRGVSEEEVLADFASLRKTERRTSNSPALE